MSVITRFYFLQSVSRHTVIESLFTIAKIQAVSPKGHGLSHIHKLLF